jgi:hypothetical protein
METSSPETSSAEISAVGRRIRSLADAAPRVPPPRIPGRPLPNMSPSEPIAPIQRPDTTTPPAELDELIPPYEAPPSKGSGAEPNDAASKRYF